MRRLRAILVRLPWWSISLLAHVWVFMMLAEAGGCLSKAKEPTAVRVGFYEGEIAPQPPGPAPGERPADEPAMPAVERLPASPDEVPTLARSTLTEPIAEPAGGSVLEPTDFLAPGRAGPAVGPGLSLIGPRALPAGRADAVRDFGGSGASERAVDRGLRWLAIHQDDTGRWSRRGYTSHCPRGEPCDPGVTNSVDLDLDVSVSGLALLAFLGRGHIHTEDGPYRETVRRGVEFLLRSQAGDGRLGPLNRYSMYHHAIAMLALSEASILSGDDRLRSAVSRAVAYAGRAQQAGGGWDYTADKTGRNDASVTGWVVLALKSADAAGAEVPWTTTYNLIRFLDRATTAAGDVVYADLGEGAGRKTTSLIAVGLASRLFLGWHPSSGDAVLQAERLLRDPPDWETLRQDNYHSGYYWYYATLGMFQMGGRYWRQWNAAQRDLLVGRQSGFGHRDGSWDPAGRWSRTGGRIYFTALCLLNLEVYYRYLPLYRQEGGALGALALGRAFRAAQDPNERAGIIRDLGQMGGRDADRTITTALGDESLAVRFEAAAVLVRRGREAGRPVLAEAAAHESSFIRARALEVLAALDEMWVVPVLIPRLLDPEPTLARTAAEGLRRITGKSFVFNPAGSSAERAATAVAYEAWWADYQKAHPSAQPYRLLGTLLATRAGSDAVVFGVRPESTVERGQVVWVYRAETWIATLRVTEVLPQMAAAVLVEAAPGQAPARGDLVTNRPGGPPRAAAPASAPASRPA